jgi:GDP-mannose 4,6-dehydratase
LFNDDLAQYPEAKLDCEFMDITDQSSVEGAVLSILQKYGKIDETYWLAAQSVTENSLLPIMYSADNQNGGKIIDYIDFKSLWNSASKRNKIEIENCNGTETEVINIPSPNDNFCALGYWNGMGTWFPIKQISRHKWKDKVVKLSQKFGSVCVTPNHSILDANQKICQPSENPWLLNVRKLNGQFGFLNSIELYLNKREFLSDDNYLYFKDSRDIKINKSLSGDSLKSFCRVIGAFISEGSISFNKNNGGYHVTISNSNKQWLESIEKDFSLFYTGKFNYTISKKDGYGDVYNLNTSSKVLYSLFEKLCGSGADSKKLPPFVFRLKDEYLKEIFNNLIYGDGCFTDINGWRYTTSSYKLGCQLSMFWTLLKYDYTVNIEQNNEKEYYHFRSCESYQPEQGKNGKKIEYLDYDGYVYDISVPSVTNFTVGLGNIVVHNSHVGDSFKCENLSINTNGMSVFYALESLRKHSIKTRFYFANTSECFGGDPQNCPFRESSPQELRSPYSLGKNLGANITKYFRQTYGMYACFGWLFNHSNIYRHSSFYFAKVILAATKINNGTQEKLKLGNLNFWRDEHLSDFGCEIMWKMLNNPKGPVDYVIGNGHANHGEEYLDYAFGYFNLDWKKYVEFDKELLRPNEVVKLVSDPTKAVMDLGWCQNRITLKQHVELVAKYFNEQVNGLKPIRIDPFKAFPEKHVPIIT